jgi:hypothetical protein
LPDRHAEKKIFFRGVAERTCADRFPHNASFDRAINSRSGKGEMANVSSVEGKLDAAQQTVSDAVRGILLWMIAVG